jgi:hypothetical protein
MHDPIANLEFNLEFRFATCWELLGTLDNGPLHQHASCATN